jgi:uncharacterized protein (DUF2267 family)
MRTGATHVFDEALQKANLWIKEVETELGWEDARRAHGALRSTLHALRDRLTVSEAAELGAQLPTLIRGIYFEGWRPAGKPLKERHRKEFLAHIEQAFRSDFAVEPERVARAVFRVLSHHVSAGEMEDVALILPAELRDLMPAERRLRRRTA